MEKDFINVKYVTENDLCNSCGFCEPVCPEKAIVIKFNNYKGYHEPIIDDELCKKCGKFTQRAYAENEKSSWM